MTIPLIFILTILSGAFGAILMKIGAKALGSVEIHSVNQALQFIVGIATTPALISGLGLYFLSALLWSYLLTKLDISLVQPILALTYVITPILAVILLSENISWLRWLGIVVIIAGVYIVARSA